MDATTNAKLKVSLFWSLRGDYWVIELGKDCEYAVVSAPGKNYLWIPARPAEMNESRYAELIGRLQAQGFDISRLRRTKHPKPAGR